MSVKKVFPQNGGFIRATEPMNELAPRVFVGKTKPFFLLHKETYWTMFC